MNKKELLILFFKENFDIINLTQEDCFVWFDLKTDFKLGMTLKYEFWNSLKLFLIVSQFTIYSIDWVKVEKYLGVKHV